MTGYMIERNLNLDVRSGRTRRLLQRKSPSPLANVPTISKNRDLTAVIVPAAAGLVVSLLFLLFFPDGLSALLTQMS